jgi:DNA-binding NarL/FixJ family response regulator
VAGGVDAVAPANSLPDVSGGDVLRQIRSDMLAAVPAGYANPAYANAVRKARVSSYLAKAAAPNDLVSAIQGTLEGGTVFPTL